MLNLLNLETKVIVLSIKYCVNLGEFGQFITEVDIQITNKTA